MLEVADQRIIIDTYIGNGKERHIPPWNHRHGPFIILLPEGGYPPGSKEHNVWLYMV